MFCVYVISFSFTKPSCHFQPGSQLSKDAAEDASNEDSKSTEGITHDEYKAIYSIWHKKIGDSSIGCLKSTEYMHTRAALIVLSRIVRVFPTQPKIGDKILKTLRPLQSDENERPDIRATAQGYSSQLMKARDDGMWKEENIAVTKARQEREKMKADEKRKKLAQQHEDMKKESEMIARQLGDNGGRDGWRPGPPDRRDIRPRGLDPRMHPRVSVCDMSTCVSSSSFVYIFISHSYYHIIGPTFECRSANVHTERRRSSARLAPSWRLTWQTRNGT